MTVPRLDRLLDPADLDALLSAAAELVPGSRIRLGDAGAPTAGDGFRSGSPTRRPIVVDGKEVGGLVVELSAATDITAPAVAELVGLAIEVAARAGSRRRSVALAVIDQELAIGRRIQLSLMPRRFPSIAGWEVASVYEPAREVGGDFYDVFRLRDDAERIGLVVADVTGKGIPAAILMADSRGLIHAAADHIADPAETLRRVNQILVDERASGLFVTVAHGVLDPATGRLVLARAGHDPVHVLRADGSLEALEPPGRLIGMVADIGVASVSVVLEPGDAFVGHTDGVTEARSADGAFYGEDRYRGLLSELAGRGAAEIVAAVASDVAEFRGAAEPSDDLTLLVVRRSDLYEPDPPPTDDRAGGYAPDEPARAGSAEDG